MMRYTATSDRESRSRKKKIKTSVMQNASLCLTRRAIISTLDFITSCIQMNINTVRLTNFAVIRI